MGDNFQEVPRGHDASHQPNPCPPRDYQDEEESRDSRLKAIWDQDLGRVKNATVSYRQAFVLLLSWHKDVDDLHTSEEVTKLENVFRDTFKYKTVQKVLTKDPRRKAQNQVNRYLAEFVDDHDDTNTLLIVYYAGHGRPGESKGSVVLEANMSAKPDDGSSLHEIVWNSAEHNIKATKSDVLLIFDCCYAGALDQNVRSNATRRAFEFLAATSANSTTRRPGERSFTTALIWALEHLVEKGKRFPTQELLSKILEAPNFPTEQVPRLGERGLACVRRIVLAPLSDDTGPDGGNSTGDFETGIREDLSVRFVFNSVITRHLVEQLVTGLRRLIIAESDLKVTTVLWEGINSSGSPKGKESLLQYYYAHKWLSGHARRKSVLCSPIESVPALVTSGSSSSDDDSVPTPPHHDGQDIATESTGVSGKPQMTNTRSTGHTVVPTTPVTPKMQPRKQNAMDSVESLIDDPVRSARRPQTLVSSLGFSNLTNKTIRALSRPSSRNPATAVNTETVAVKKVKLPKGSDDFEAFQSRVACVLKDIVVMNHPPLADCDHILDLLGYGWNIGEGSIPILVTEFAPGRTLRQFLQENTETSGMEIVHFCRDVIAGLSELHSAGVIHGDLKLDNVLVVDMKAKISDFGHSLLMKPADEDEARQAYRGTELYNPPEITQQDRIDWETIDLRKCDMWALGLLCWEAMRRGKPFYEDRFVAAILSENDRNRSQSSLGSLPETTSLHSHSSVLSNIARVQGRLKLEAQRYSNKGLKLLTPAFTASMLKRVFEATWETDPVTRLGDASLMENSQLHET
ncbi:hypothetical protein BP6252_03400 [Coleophoma cylindrospora]|uniref:Protein kinase domain-containing protein n=1 Tax=Coleophoma cylindrospora TaxID=1849047 RepID=A0A3D8S928_9HELO|nr:hypothetical protein BP6252_03400 [Coleophoma cylindrospora]